MTEQIYTSVVDFKTNTGILIDDNIIEGALIFSTQLMKTVIFLKKIYTITEATDEIKIEVPVADYSCDGEITKDDFLIYELDDKNYVTPETDIKSEVASFVSKYGFITLNDSYPTSGKKLVIEAYTARFENDIMIPYLKRLNILLACDYLFTNIPISTLQNGISNWSLNGVSISFDMNSFGAIKESIKQEMTKVIKFITPVVAYKTTMGFGKDDYAGRSRFNINSPTRRRY